VSASSKADRSTDALLADGTVVQIRPIEPSDAPGLERFHAALSPETIRMRFFTPHPRLSAAELELFTVVDHRDRGCPARVRPKQGEVAITDSSDSWPRRSATTGG
jgi:hypothetical protein